MKIRKSVSSNLIPVHSGLKLFYFCVCVETGRLFSELKFLNHSQNWIVTFDCQYTAPKEWTAMCISMAPFGDSDFWRNFMCNEENSSIICEFYVFSYSQNFVEFFN